MKAEELIDIIRSGRKEGEDIRNMELLMEQFPYFATIRIVYLKMLHDSGHSAYPEKLKHNTIYIPDHKQFYRFLNNLLSDWDEVGNPVFKTGTLLPLNCWQTRRGEESRSHDHVLPA